MKFRRQKKILEIIENQVVSTQEELADALREGGFDITQATVSRDIKELQLVKVPIEDNTYRYGLPGEKKPHQNEERLRRVLRERVTELDYSENIIVMRTYPGNAPSVAALLDGAHWKEVIGSVAGDDTILLVVKPLQAVDDLVSKLKSLMG